MRKQLLGFTAAIFVANGMNTSRIFGQVEMPPQPGQGTVDRPAGPGAGAIADDGTREVNVVRDTLGRAASAALSEKFSGIGDFIIDADKQRLGDKLNDSDSRLAEQIVELHRVWKEKYKQEFDLRANLAALNAPGLRILPANPTASADAARPLADPADKTDKDLGNAVIASLPAGKNIPAVEIKLMREALGRDWKIDLPNSMDAVQLRTNLKDRLSILFADQRNWPSDAKEAYRLIAQQTLAALVTTPVRTATGALP